MVGEAEPKSRPALFFDRDGTLIEETDHLCRLDDVRILPEAVEAVRVARRVGWLPVVVTNQSAVARGLLSEDDLKTIHQAIGEAFRRQKAAIEAFYFCPHHPDYGVKPYRRACTCRKPNPGLILRAAHDLGIDLEGSFVIGDAPTDVEAGCRAGCGAVLVKTARAAHFSPAPDFQHQGWTGSEDGPGTCSPDFAAENVLEAVRWIIQKETLKNE